ncbi:Tetraspanin EC2 domain [Echinococcus multilocularis]|uniref:Tetraspanin EC2 domain n=1 Tax=Echinococcus multilocularis TaxID=6211 RepID=A0A087W1V4_ECHMU|nr:Tetraspanin EC2 domain [Echinococcus multilocularis]
MTASLISIFGFLLTVCIILNGHLTLFWLLPGIQTGQLKNDNFHLVSHDRLVRRTYYYVYFEFVISAVCCSFWFLRLLSGLMVPRLPKRKKALVTSILRQSRKYIVRPLTLILFITSTFATIAAFDDAGLLKSDVANFFNRIFYQLQDTDPNKDDNRQQRLLQYLESIQRGYRCCGGTSILDWFGISLGAGKSVQSQALSDTYIPASCLNSRRSSVLVPQRISDLHTLMKGIHLDKVTIYAPVFRKGCIKAVGDRLYLEFYGFLKCTSLTDLALNVCLLLMIVFDHWDHSSSVGTKADKAKLKKYVSNAKLLQAIQGTPLLAKQVKLQEVYGNAKAGWLEKGSRNGWCLVNNGKQDSEYVRRIYTRRTENPGQIKTSGFRRFLRTYLPLVEAVLYTDGDSRYEVEGNDYYGGFIVTVVRVIFCGLYGYIGAHILISAFITSYKAAPAEGDIAKAEQVNSATKEREKIVEELAYMTSVLVRIAFVIAAIVSKRFRCLLALLGPNLGLTAGQSFIAAELTNVAVHGPVRGLATNLRAAGGSLNCLMKLSGNITNDANKLLKPSGKGTSEDEFEEIEEDENDDEDENLDINSMSNDTQQNFTGIVRGTDKSKLVKYPKLKSITNFNSFFVKLIKKASRGINRGASFLRKLTMKVQKELLRDSEAKPSTNNTQNNATNALGEKQSNADIQATNAGVSESFRRHLDEMDTSEKERMRIRRKMMQAKMTAAVKNLNLGRNESYILNSAIALGHRIDSKMRARLLKACMAMQQARTEQCNVAAVTACYRIQTSAIISTGLPLFIGPWCSSYVTKGTACPTGEALENAKTECGNSGYSIGLKDGFGAQFAVAQSGLQQFAQNFRIVVAYKKLKSAAAQIRALQHNTEDAIEQLAYLTLDATRAVFAIALLFSTLLKLLFISLLLKTQSYISKYLKDMDFDNIYVEDVYEKIDERRKNESRMYLLPLKSHERKTVFWHKIGYTGPEWIRAIKAVIKSAILGIGLTMLFAADSYLHSLMIVLDVVTQGDLRLGGSSGQSDTSSAAMLLAGDGFAAELIKGILDGFLNLMNIDLTYKLSACAPKVILSSHDLRFRFGILWSTLLLLGMFSGYLLRLRHIVAGFFYPNAHRRRQMHLYNTMLANRVRDLNTNRNLLVQRVKENRLQHEVRLLSKPPTLAEVAPKLAKVLKLRKGTCVICRDTRKPGREMYICPVDACATCRQCQRSISNDPEFCVACVDRNEASITDTLKKLEQMYKNRQLNVI